MTSTQQHTTIGSRVPLDFAQQVRQAAEAEDRSIGSFIRQAIRNELERTSTSHQHERQVA
jgi:predicted transcriptional regulator